VVIIRRWLPYTVTTTHEFDCTYPYIPLVSIASFIEELGHLCCLSAASFTADDHYRVLINGFHYYLFFS
jgi:hypothetical protein